MGAAKQTLARLIDQRARRRATQALINNHPDEWKDLLAAFVEEATAEARQLEIVRQAAEEGQHEHAVPSPVRLMPGARKEGQSVLERIDVARCSQCISNHDRGHVCPHCGRAPKRTFTEAVDEVRRLHDAGTKVEMIALNLRIPIDHVHRLLEEA